MIGVVATMITFTGGTGAGFYLPPVTSIAQIGGSIAIAVSMVYPVF